MITFQTSRAVEIAVFRLAVLLVSMLVASGTGFAKVLWSDLGATLAHETGPGTDILGGAVKRDNSSAGALYFKFHVDPISDISTEEYFAGFQLFEGETKRLGVGNAMKAWAYSAFHTAETGEFNKVAGDFDLRSSRPETIGMNDFRNYERPRGAIENTILFKVEYVQGENDRVTVWLNPDLGAGATESSQPESLTTRFLAEASFDQIRVRHGGGGGGWTFSDMVIATEFADLVAARGPEQPISAGGAGFTFRSWQREQGLPQNRVRALFQSRSGYLWLGLDDGIARFDGVRFVSYGQPEGLRCGPVRHILEDRHGALWIGGISGGLIRWANGHFTTFTVADGLPSNSITALAEDPQGNLWVGTSGGLAVWQDNYWTTLGDAELIKGKSITALFQDSTGGMWVGVRGTGILIFRNGSFASVTDPAVEALLRDAHCILVDRSERLWVGAGDDFVLCREGNEWRRYRIPRPLDKPLVTTIVEGPQGTVWAGSASEGVFQFEGGKLNTINATAGLVENSVESLLADREGNLWVGTTAGLSQLRPRKVAVLGREQGLGYGPVQGLAQLADGTIWAGKSAEGLYAWLGRGFGRLSFEGISKEDLQTATLLASQDGGCWVGTSRGLYHMPQVELQSKAPEVLLKGKAVLALAAGPEQGGVWAGTQNGEVWQVQGGQCTAQTNWMRSSPITTLLPDGGGIWIGTDGDGLHRFHRGQHDRYGKAAGLLADSIRVLYRDTEGAVWIGTAGGGLARWRDGRISNFTTREGLPDDTIVQILEDDSHALWLGTSRGIACVSKVDLEAVSSGKEKTLYPGLYGRAEGMPSEECSGGFWPSGLRTSTGALWFPTSKGIVVVPKLARAGAQPPPMVVEQVLVDGVPAAGWDGTATRRPNGNGGSAGSSVVKVPPGRHRVEFFYTALTFDAPEKVRFRHRIEGLDSDWVEAGTSRSAFYSYIPPGEHQFTVVACDTHGVWNVTGASATVRVSRFVWQTWWFLTISALVLLMAVVQAIRAIEKRKLSNRLRELEHERALERERARIAQDLHDDLGASLSRISLLSDMARVGTGSGAAPAESQMNRIATLAGQTLRALDEIVWAVRPGSDSLQSLVDYIAHFANELFKDSGIRCTLELPENLPARTLEPEVRHDIFLIAKEALNNALKHAAPSEVCVVVQADAERLSLVIRDDGNGFDLSLFEKENEDGLENMRMRANAVGGMLNIESAPGKGTTVRLSVEFATALNRKHLDRR